VTSAGDALRVVTPLLAIRRDLEDALVEGRVLVAKTKSSGETAKAWTALNILTMRKMPTWIRTLVGRASQAASAHTSRQHKTVTDRCIASTRAHIRRMHYNTSVAKWPRLKPYTRLAAP